MYYPIGSMKEVVEKLEKGEYVLPAIQREYVWKREQICKFFDSLMQGFPVGIFLFWRLNSSSRAEQPFFKFIERFEADASANRDRIKSDELHESATAVLDGQQRLTSVNIALKGCFNSKKGGSEALYVNLFSGPNGESALRYKFEFRGGSSVFERSEGALWYKVSDVLSFDSADEIYEKVQNEVKDDCYDLRRMASSIAGKLYAVVNNEQLFWSYTEKSTSINNILEIFIRMNSGGTVLSYSDLLFSTAVMRWSNLDGRKEIQDALDALTRLGTDLPFSKDFVLKSGLMLCDLPISFKVETFNPGNMAILESSWSDIKPYMPLAAKLISSFGLNGKNMRALGPVHVIAYYLKESNRPSNYVEARSFQADRMLVRDWLVRSLLKKNIWNEGIDQMLTALRDAIHGNSANGFPVVQIERAMADKGKSLIFDSKEVSELLTCKYTDKKCRLIMSILYPYFNLKHNVHVDHFYPKNRLSAKSTKGLGSSAVQEVNKYRDRICNLIFLEGPENQSKNNKLPLTWLNDLFADPQQKGLFILHNNIPFVPEDAQTFLDFCRKRNAILNDKLHGILSVPIPTQERGLEVAA